MTKQEFLAMSLPHGVKILWRDDDIVILEPRIIRFIFDNNEYTKPILHPLSDLTKTIVHKGEKFVPLHRLLENNNFDLDEMSEEHIMSFEETFMSPDLITLSDLPLYLEWHFDLFGGVSKGEAVDVNTLPENPYK